MSLATPLVALASLALPQELVVDLAEGPPPPADSSPALFETIESGSYVLFQARDEANTELWRLDAGGVERIGDLMPGSQGSHPAFFTDLGGGVALFVANHPDAGRELWRTDGTAAGTSLVADVWPGIRSSNPGRLAASNGTAFFTATTEAEGAELWTTDGTTAGTQLVADLTPGPDSSVLRSPLMIGSTYYFTRHDASGSALWRSDGTAAGTFALVPDGMDSSAFLAEVGGRLLFFRETPANGRELWSSDGTVAGTQLAVDLVPGPDSPGADVPSLAQGDLWFAANQPGVAGLWRTDGTPGGTTLASQLPHLWPWNAFLSVAETEHGIVFLRINGSKGLSLWGTSGVPGSEFQLLDEEDIDFGALCEAGGNVYVSNADSSSIWVSDGVDVTTTQQVSGSPAAFNAVGDCAVLSDVLILRADGELEGQELWGVVGDSTFLLADLHESGETGSLGVVGLERLGDRLVLVGWSIEPDPQSHLKGHLLETQGTAATTSSITDLPDIPSGSEVTVFDEHAFFETAAEDQLWTTDGTAAGTTLLLDDDVFDVQWMGRVEDRFLFFGLDGELRVTDATPAGTALIPGYDVFGGTEFQGEVWFLAKTQADGFELHRTDGTPAGTTLGVEILPGPSGILPLSGPVSTGDRLYVFGVEPGTGVPRLWATDGSQAGTHAVPGLSTSPKTPAIVVGTDLVFPVETVAEGLELWTANDQGAALAIDLAPGPDSGVHQWPGSRLGNAVVFRGSDGTTSGLFRYDLSQGSASLLTSTAAAVGVSDFELVSPNSLVFSLDGPFGFEPWITDGTPGGTRMLADLHPGPGSSYPNRFTRFEDQLLFFADDGVHGNELYTLPFTELGDWAAEPYGWGCNGSTLSAPAIASAGPATPGATMDVTGSGALAGTPAILLVGTAEPFDIDADCPLWTGVPFELAGVDVTDIDGSATRGLLVPSGPSIVGAVFTAQWLFADPGGELMGIGSATPGLEIVVGP